MTINTSAVRRCLKTFDFATLFREHLGWDNHQQTLPLIVDGQSITLSAVAEKRGLVAFVCSSIPERPVRLKIDHQVTKAVKEHFVIYCDRAAGHQVWHWVRREAGKPLASRDHRFEVGQPGDRLIQRLEQIAVSLAAEPDLTLVDVNADVRAAFDVDRITKRFYDQFKSEHAAFLKFIKGIDIATDLEWYTSLMLNRLMFVYFIQKKGFLDGDVDYLRNRLQRVREVRGRDKFQTFYRYFLVRLFHEGLGKAAEDRKLDPDLERLLGKVPYLNGGFFEVHQLEERHAGIDIPDKAFERLFEFFDRYAWHLDDRPLRADNEINPDVVGYIFEKYVNQKQMGAYYTKEDITEYISKNTIIPFLFDAARARCPIAFEPDGFIWRLLRDDPDRYIYAAVRHGVIAAAGAVVALPTEIAAGLDDVAKREGWNRSAPAPFALPTETWREHVARRTRCLEIREKLRAGGVHNINDLVTLNLDIWQFARDAIANAEGPELVRAFWGAIAKLTVLDPTCGSGAFLFAALRILETLYADCLERMERFVEDHEARPHHPEHFTAFRKILAQIESHPNERYFILKSIIIGNLYGVDIMEEAVEICKLRLFLKLAAEVESADRIEPLPDIDFNIRSGNSLVGYATKQDARRGFTQNVAGQGKLMIGDTDKAYERFEESATIVDSAFRQFRAQQTMHGGRITLADKQQLRHRLAGLDAELDRFLAGEYGVKTKNRTDFDRWQRSHQPFHWFVHFYGIMREGFDIIIGNPPYVEYKDVQDQYAVRSFATLECGDLYAYCTEVAFRLLRHNGRLGLIVPISIFGTDGFRPLQELVVKKSNELWISSFANRPSQLFDGAQKRLSVVLAVKDGQAATKIHTTRYLRWRREEFANLFRAGLRYGPPHACFTVFPASLEKLGSSTEVSAFGRIVAKDQTLARGLSERGQHPVYYTRKFGYFLAFLDFIPDVRQIKTGKRLNPTELKELDFQSDDGADICVSALSSSTFFWFWNVVSDCRNLNRRDLLAFRVNPSALPSSLAGDLARLGRRYLKELRRTSRTMTKSGLELETFDYASPKPVLDEIDRQLADYFGFSDAELDFILNYDIKYRVGSDEPAEDE